MDDEKRVIDLVVNTFGMYGGKVLKRIMKYYILINRKYGIDTEEGLRTYIHDMLGKAS